MPKANLLSKAAPLKGFPISTDGNCVLIFKAKVFSSGQTSLLHTPYNQSIRKFFRNSSFTNCTFKYIYNWSLLITCTAANLIRHLLLGLPSDLLTHLRAQARLSSVYSQHSSHNHPLKIKVGIAQSPAVFSQFTGVKIKKSGPLCVSLCHFLLFPSFIYLQPHFPPCCSSDTPGTVILRVLPAMLVPLRQ